MKRTVRQLGKGGFTLIEVLVTLILLAVLVAAVFPVVTQQSEQGDPVRVANDLGAIRTAVGQFRLNVRPDYPADLEDLVYSPSSDKSLKGVVYSNKTNWNGPYLDIGLAEDETETPVVAALNTALGGQIQGDFHCLAPSSFTPVDPVTNCASGQFVAVEIQQISDSEANLLEEQLDGNEDVTVNSNNLNGKFRYNSGTDSGYYIVGPFF